MYDGKLSIVVTGMKHLQEHGRPERSAGASADRTTRRASRRSATRAPKPTTRQADRVRRTPTGAPGGTAPHRRTAQGRARGPPSGVPSDGSAASVVHEGAGDDGLTTTEGLVDSGDPAEGPAQVAAAAAGHAARAPPTPPAPHIGWRTGGGPEQPPLRGRLRRIGADDGEAGAGEQVTGEPRPGRRRPGRSDGCPAPRGRPPATSRRGSGRARRPSRPAGHRAARSPGASRPARAARAPRADEDASVQRRVQAGRQLSVPQGVEDGGQDHDRVADRPGPLDQRPGLRERLGNRRCHTGAAGAAGVAVAGQPFQVGGQDVVEGRQTPVGPADVRARLRDRLGALFARSPPASGQSAGSAVPSARRAKSCGTQERTCPRVLRHSSRTGRPARPVTSG